MIPTAKSASDNRRRRNLIAKYRTAFRAAMKSEAISRSRPLVGSRVNQAWSKISTPQRDKHISIPMRSYSAVDVYQLQTNSSSTSSEPVLIQGHADSGIHGHFFKLAQFALGGDATRRDNG